MEPRRAAGAFSLRLSTRYWYSAYGSTWTCRHGEFPRCHWFDAREFTPHQFVGKAGYSGDGDSGMLLLGRRYYLPRLQWFLTQDPRATMLD